MNVAAVRRLEAVGFAIAMAGLVVGYFSGTMGATHATTVFNLIFVGPLTLPAFGMPASIVLLAVTHRRRGRVFAALWAVGNAASVLIVRMRAGNAVINLDVFLCAAIAVAVGACLCIVPPKDTPGVVTPSTPATADG